MLPGLSKPEKRSWKTFSGYRKVNFRKKHILTIFCVIFQKKLT